MCILTSFRGLRAPENWSVFSYLLVQNSIYLTLLVISKCKDLTQIGTALGTLVVPFDLILLILYENLYKSVSCNYLKSLENKTTIKLRQCVLLIYSY